MFQSKVLQNHMGKERLRTATHTPLKRPKAKHVEMEDLAQ